LTRSQVRRFALARLLEDSLKGENAAASALIVAMTPIVRHRVARALRRHGGNGELGQNDDLQDLTQEVWASLFAHGARALRGWRINGGLSLENFVGLMAYRRAVSLLRARATREITLPLADESTWYELSAPSSDPEVRAASRELLGALLDRLIPTLSTRDRALFEALFLHESASLDLVPEGTKLNAVHTWKSRFVRRARAVIGELEAGSSGVADQTRNLPATPVPPARPAEATKE
jgi:DNA-directed RNA polymerase specialized sigma24 family protein